MTDARGGETVRGVVMAGGGSTRFDAGDKALALVDGVPMLARVATALRDATGRAPAVAAGDDPPTDYRALLESDAVFVPDDPGFRGPLAGFAGAARALDDDWLLTAACDMPRLDAPTLRWLGGERDGSGDAVVAADSNGTLQPLCACYRRETVLAALDHVDEHAGPRALLDRLDVRVRTPTNAPEGVDLDAALANVNTSEELERVE